MNTKHTLSDASEAPPPVTSSHAQCPNCGSLPAGRFCQHCGLEQGEWIVPVSTWVRNLASDVFDFDGRFFRSLRELPTYLRGRI